MKRDGLAPIGAVVLALAAVVPAGAQDSAPDTSPPVVEIRDADIEELRIDGDGRRGVADVSIEAFIEDFLSPPVSVQCAVDDGALAPCGKPARGGNTALDFSGLPSGPHDVTIEATDAVGNVKSLETDVRVPFGGRAVGKGLVLAEAGSDRIARAECFEISNCARWRVRVCKKLDDDLFRCRAAIKLVYGPSGEPDGDFLFSLAALDWHRDGAGEPLELIGGTRWGGAG